MIEECDFCRLATWTPCLSQVRAQQCPNSNGASDAAIAASRRMTKQPLKCPGVGRDKDCISALQFYFNRPVTDDEMRFLHEVVQRAVACMPATTPDHLPPGARA